MSYRDENEALRARIGQLEDEVRVLRAKLEPPRPVEASPPPDSTSRRRARTRAVAGLIIVMVIIAAAGIVSRTRLWRSANPQASSPVEHEASPVWRQDKTFVCPEDGDVTLRNKTIHVADGPAIWAERKCHLRLVQCDIKAPRAVDLVGDNVVSIEESRIEGTQVAIAVGSGSEVQAVGSTIVGEITPSDAKVRGVTELPLDRLTKDRHAVAPLEHIPRAQELARFGPEGQLRSIQVKYLDKRGLLDLDASDYKGEVEYFYEAPWHDDAPESAPSRPGLPVPQRKTWQRIVRSVRLDANGMRVSSQTFQYEPPCAGVTPPRCTMAQVWDAGRRAGVPEDAVARVTFDAMGPGAWRFAVDGTKIAIDVPNATCDLVSPR